MMNIQAENIIEVIKKAKSDYGLNYSKLAREIGVQPITIYTFLNNTQKLAKEKQIKALYYAQQYVKEIKEQLATIEHKGICM